MSDEIKNKAVELTDEEVEKVTGGEATNPINGWHAEYDTPADRTVKCPSCLRNFTFLDKNPSQKKPLIMPACSNCGYKCPNYGRMMGWSKTRNLCDFCNLYHD